MCEPWQNPKTLEERNSNMIVALPLKVLTGHTEEYCGKEIIAHFNGKTVGGLIAWDGCVACDGNVSLLYMDSSAMQIAHHGTLNPVVVGFSYLV